MSRNGTLSNDPAHSQPSVRERLTQLWFPGKHRTDCDAQVLIVISSCCELGNGSKLCPGYPLPANSADFVEGCCLLNAIGRCGKNSRKSASALAGPTIPRSLVSSFDEPCCLPGVVNRTFGNRTQSNSIARLSSIGFDNRT